MMYQIVHRLVAIPLQPNIQWNTRVTRGHNTKFLVPPVRVDAYRFSFFPATVTLWNNLPTAVVLSPSVDSFKNHVAAVRLTSNDFNQPSPQLPVFRLHWAYHCTSCFYLQLYTCCLHRSLLPVPVLWFMFLLYVLLCMEHIFWYACTMDHARWYSVSDFRTL